MLARLTVYHSERPTQQFYLEHDLEYFIGRDERCALYVEDRRLSRRHALLARSAAGWELSDLGSKNGTYVGGHPVSTRLLEDRQWLEFGGLLARFDLVPRERRDADQRQAEIRWDTSVALSRAILPTMNLAALSRRVLASVVDVAAAERGFVMLRREPGEFVVDASLPETV
ncbi:MAG: FHA domain-containing protein, partial [Woeseiaceae bacterium]